MAFVFPPSFVAGTTLVISDIRSQNYTPGVAGWIIEADGDAEFNNVTIRGRIIGGTIPGPHYEINGADAPHGLAFYTAHPNESFPAVIQPDSSVTEATLGINGAILDGAENPGITLGTTRVASGGGTRIDMSATHADWSIADLLIGSSGVGEQIALDQVANFVRLQGTSVVLQDGATSDGVYVHDGLIERFLGGSDETWHVVGAGGEPAFAGNWAVQAGSTVGFYMDASGRVQLRGRGLEAVAASTVIFTLPGAGFYSASSPSYRPTQTMSWAVKSNNDAATVSWLQVGTNGAVTLIGNVAQGRVQTILDAVSFPTF